MSSIRSIDILLIDDLFEMGSGYVLNFSDRTFAEFFARELEIDIGDATYARNGGSKAKRLRCFLQTVDDTTAVRTLHALWEYREALRLHQQREESIINAESRLNILIQRLSNDSDGGIKATSAPPIKTDSGRIRQLGRELVTISELAPQARGYSFEQFLKSLFDVHGMEGREPFRVRGEQIDGSFQLEGETYLLEAKWQNSPTGVAELHAFNGKVEEKAAWARGLFVSYSGFTEDGLHAFGRGKRLICMDGYDLSEILSQELSLADVLKRKARRAAETGFPFVRIRDLYAA